MGVCGWMGGFGKADAMSESEKGMSEPLNLLVLGVGGNVSQGILKALALSGLRLRVLGACTSASGLGLYTTDRSFISPSAADPEFPGWLEELCRRESVDGVLSGVEPVLEQLVKVADLLRKRTGAVALVNRAEAVEIGACKLRTCEWLAGEGLPYPRYADGRDPEAVRQLVETCGFPLLVKPARGKGSQGIFHLRSEEDLAVLRFVDEPVVQELLGRDEDEYTVSTLTDREDKSAGVIVFHRELSSGTTSAATAGEFPEVREMAEKVFERLRPRGPCNLQCRMHRGEPVPFELNVRFSGTTPIRARLGFNDVAEAVRHYILGQPMNSLPLVTSGRVVRYWNELYIDDGARETLLERGELKEPHSVARPRLESYGGDL